MQIRAIVPYCAPVMQWGSDIAVLTTKYGYNTAYTLNQMHNSTDSRTNFFWSLLYKVINNSNNIIAHVDAAEGTQADKDRLKGQAVALRANSYLMLTSFYQFSYLKDPDAPGVPLYTEPSDESTPAKPRASLREVYKQINADLQQAASLLHAYTRPGSVKYKINKDVVNGLLARTALNTGQWAAAASYAALARKGYGFMTEAQYLEGFNNVNNPEWIWGHGQTPEQSVASYSFQYLDVTSTAGYYSFMADPYFMQLFSKGDIRKKLFLWDGLKGREGYLRYQKFRMRPDETGDIVLMRSSEMVLIEAEGHARAGDLAAATERLNKLRAVRNDILLNAGETSQQSLVDTVLKERRKELWGEGFSLWDILRTQGKVERRAYVDANNEPVKVEVITQDGSPKVVDAIGHSSLKFSDGSPFVPNSPYYVFAIPYVEKENNPNVSP